MKVEFNGVSYNIGYKRGQSACSGCIINEGFKLQCPVDSEEQCVLPLNKIYTEVNSFQVFKL